ncbi:Uma2 family endonuclease [Clostridium sp.]|uniref:Uma2 family endonuclease n=1 Tax=Clostridium sp. TaxID=1506 RepID=UPI00261ED3E9|nr:Uma2 family endonuclease [Clostridium sp.]
MLVAINAIDNKIYTYDDYLKFSDDKPVEIIDGRVSAMSPAPSRIHQKIILKLSTSIETYIQSNNGECEVYPAPFDVILKADDENINNSKNIVQPDISVVCDKNKLNDKGCIGSPDMIIEVVSPFNPSNDYIKKLSLYEKFKVREYWIVNPMEENILVYTLTNNDYAAPKVYSFDDKIKVNIYTDLYINFKSFDLS